MSVRVVGLLLEVDVFNTYQYFVTSYLFQMFFHADFIKTWQCTLPYITVSSTNTGTCTLLKGNVLTLMVVIV